MKRPWGKIWRATRSSRLGSPYEWHTHDFACIRIGDRGSSVRLSPALAMNERLCNRLAHLALFRYDVRQALAFDWNRPPTSTAKADPNPPGKSCRTSFPVTPSAEYVATPTKSRASAR